MKAFALSWAACLCLASPLSAQKFDGLAQTPPMGWNSWNTFGTNIDEKLVRGVADAMVTSGMQAAGYQYVVLDDGWSAMDRDANGHLVAHPDKFPSGMRALGDYLHSKGLKFGIYNCAGTKTCAGYPGSQGYEGVDARTYASWGVDYLKYDWCNTDGADVKDRFKMMRDALHDAGRPVVLSMCEWGQSKPWTWAKDVAHLWRTTYDITDCWDCRRQWSSGFKHLLDAQNDLAQYAGPGHWNDPDMLEVGNPGLTLAESRAHFSLWCVLAAPLMAGNDVRGMTPEIRGILTNRDVVAIDQDRLGKQGYRVWQGNGYEIWIKELSGGDRAACVLNTRDEPALVDFSWSKLNQPLPHFKLHDVWQNKDLGTTDQPFSRKIDSHDVVLLRLTPVSAGQ
jgi:alpha-galactosidase